MSVCNLPWVLSLIKSVCGSAVLASIELFIVSDYESDGFAECLYVGCFIDQPMIKCHADIANKGQAFLAYLA